MNTNWGLTGGRINHYPRHIGDYLKKTIGLTMQQDGAYNRAIDLYYSLEQQLPLTPALYLALRCHSKSDRDAVDFVLVTYFEKTPTGYRHGRCEQELEAQRERTAKAAKGAAAKWSQAPPKHEPSIAQASAKHDPSSGQADACEMPASSHKPEASSQRKEKVNGNVGLTPDDTAKPPTGKPLHDAAKRVLEVLNINAGRRYESVDANINPILARMREGYSERELCAIAAVKARQWQGDERMAQYIRPKTLFNATNAAQYRGELPANKIEDSGAGLS